MHSLSVMHSDASKMQHFRVSQSFFYTETRSDASCYCMRRNAFENLEKLFKNITLYFTIDPFLSLHDIPIST